MSLWPPKWPNSPAAPREEPEKENSSGPGSSTSAPVGPERIRGASYLSCPWACCPQLATCHLQAPALPCGFCPCLYLWPLFRGLHTTFSEGPSPRQLLPQTSSEGRTSQNAQLPSILPKGGQTPPSLGLTQVSIWVLSSGAQGQAPEAVACV